MNSPQKARGSRVQRRAGEWAEHTALVATCLLQERVFPVERSAHPITEEADLVGCG